MNVAPVTIAISCNISFLRSPKPGAFTASTLNTPRSLFTMSVVSASPSTSSATISNSFLPLATIFSSKLQNFLDRRNFLVRHEHIRLFECRLPSVPGSSPCIAKRSRGRTACLRRFRYELPIVFESSTVTTPSLPIFSMTVAIRPPISSSFAESVATSFIFLLSLMSLALAFERLHDRARSPSSIPPQAGSR